MARDDPEIRPDSLRANDSVEVILGLGEGEIKGLVNGTKSFYVGDTPVENSDGSLNFKDWSVTIYPGVTNPDPIKPVLGGFSPSTNVGVGLEYNQAVTRTGTRKNINLLELRLVFQQLVKTTDNGQFETSARFAIEIKPTSSPTWTNPFGKDFIVTGKLTSGSYPKEVVINVDQVNDTYDIRIRRTYPDEDDDERKCTVSWESFQEIFTEPMSFPNLAVAHIKGQATSQISNSLEFYGIYDGVLVKVPSNYDAATRTYTGTWDGTFKRAYTNDPAWILYDLVMSGTYGLNAYDQVVLDKWDVYEASKWCSEQVPDGAGGKHTRFDLDYVITDEKPAKELARFIAGTFNGVFFDDGNGTASIQIDKPESAVHLFTPENVHEGLFDYSFTDVTTRYNDISVSFINPDLGWEEDRRRVYDQDDIDRNGRIPLDFVAIGCHRPQDAVRRARHKLITGLTEKMMVRFKINRLAHAVRLYEIALIGDVSLGYSITGRAVSLESNRTQVNLRDRIYIEAGVSYELSVASVDSQYPAKSNSAYKVTTIALDENTPRGYVNYVTLTKALPADLPDFFNFSLAQPEESESEGIYPIGVEDTGYTDAVEVSEDINFTLVPMEYDDTTGGDGGGGGGGSQVVVKYKYGTPKPFRILSVSEVDGNPDLFEVTALEVNRDKQEFIDDGGSITASRKSQVDTTYTPTPSNFTGNFVSRNIDGETKPVLVLAWTTVNPALIRANIVTASFNGGPAYELIRAARDEVELIDPETGYYVFTLVSQNMFGSTSTPITLEIDIGGILTDVPPLPTSVDALGGVRQATIKWAAVTSDGVIGYKIWASNNPGFTPGGSTLRLRTASTQATIPLTVGTWYFRVAAYDQFDNTSYYLQHPGNRSVRVRLRFLVTRPANIQDMITQLRNLLKLCRLNLEVVDLVDISRPADQEVITEALLSTPSTQHLALYNAAKSDWAQDDDIVVFFVDSIHNAANTLSYRGVGTTGIPSALVATSATVYTMAHEVLHCLGLVHVSNSDNIMLSNTAGITHPPPDISNDQIEVVNDSRRLFDYWYTIKTDVTS